MSQLRRKWYTGYTIYDDNGRATPEYLWLTPDQFFSRLDDKENKKRVLKERADLAAIYVKEDDERRAQEARWERSKYFRDLAKKKAQPKVVQVNAKLQRSIDLPRNSETIQRRRRAAMARRNWLIKNRLNKTSYNSRYSSRYKRPITYVTRTIY